MKTKTTMKIVCAWCGADMGEKDGQGTTGTTHGICEKCFRKQGRRRFLHKINFFARIRGRREANRKAEENEALRLLVSSNSNLHTQLMLRGKRGIHYILTEDLAELKARATDQPEVKCKWN